MNRDICDVKTAFKEDCKPCKGPGICQEITDATTCKHFRRLNKGCNWKGYKHGSGCSAEVEGYKCWSMGDPHIHGFEPDVATWDFMGIGEYYFLDSPRLKIQVRQQETRTNKATSNLALAWHGPEYSCHGGKATCSNTCGFTYELHPGHRVTKVKGETFGDFEYEATLIVHNVAGAEPEYWTFTGKTDIINELTKGNLCSDLKGGKAEFGKTTK